MGEWVPSPASPQRHGLWPIRGQAFISLLGGQAPIPIVWRVSANSDYLTGKRFFPLFGAQAPFPLFGG